MVQIVPGGGSNRIIVLPNMPEHHELPNPKTVFRLVSNYGSFVEAVQSGEYDYLWGQAERPETVPVQPGPVNTRTRVIPLGDLFPSGKVHMPLSAIVQLCPKLALPIELATFGHYNWPETLKAPTMTAWKAGEKFWRAFLISAGGGYHRALGIFESDPTTPIHRHYYGLVRLDES